ncbi:MAG: hypothetical protein HY360_11735 [Verrucomicrobia bacterium]|nr:hypothetical protein [Verrucomicrobiota bacterium]
MINSVNISADVVRPAERTLASEVAEVSPKAEAVSQDTAVVSAFSREHEAYMKMLQALPDVRPDVVQRMRESVMPTAKYPPLDMVDGIAKLVGKMIV